MKAVKTPETNVTLTLPGGTEENDLPAVRAMLYDQSRGQTQQDASLGWVSTWMPDEAEARKLEAGACVELTVWGEGHPPVALGVTDAVVPERELIERGTVDRALGLLYARLKDRMNSAIAQAIDEDVPTEQLVDTGGDPNAEAVGLPEAGAFVDLWVDCVAEVVEAQKPPPRAPADASTLEDPEPVPAPPHDDCAAPDRVCPTPDGCEKAGSCGARHSKAPDA